MNTKQKLELEHDNEMDTRFYCEHFSLTESTPLEKLYKQMWETEKAHAERLAEALRKQLVNPSIKTINESREALAQWEQQR